MTEGRIVYAAWRRSHIRDTFAVDWQVWKLDAADHVVGAGSVQGAGGFNNAPVVEGEGMSAREPRAPKVGMRSRQRGLAESIVMGAGRLEVPIRVTAIAWHGAGPGIGRGFAERRRPDNAGCAIQGAAA